MKKTIKVIDLLNMIANKEKMLIIKHDGKYGKYDEKGKCYKFYNDKECKDYFGSWFNWELSNEGLNDKVEIIEEGEKPKEIEVLPYKYKNMYGNISAHRHSEVDIINKVNELAKAVNYLLKKEKDKNS